MAMTLFGQLRARMAARSGTAPSLTARATGIPSALLDAATVGAVAPDAEVGATLTGLDAEGAAAPGRRGRAPAPGETVLVDGVGEKVLGFWLQNRHQVLFPLTVNLATLPTTHGCTVARMMAVALLAGPTPGEQDRQIAHDWLARAGATPEVLEAFGQAVRSPPALSGAIAAVLEAPNLTAYAYVVALIALGLNDETALFFLDYLAARLALPSNVVRSANRRYRR